MHKALTEIKFILDKSGSMGGAIHHIGNVHKYAREEDRPEKTIFIITTDGEENSNRHYTYDKIKKMEERQKEKYGWEFISLGANIDAITEAAKFGVGADRAATYMCDEKGKALNYEVLNEAVTCVRTHKAVPPVLLRKIDDDRRKKGGK